ncbi:MAG: hypothetical protein HY663_02205, partial [Chloroflexi bacterium]|nr:hypothetical protein [Chloroflexota bacterium]
YMDMYTPLDQLPQSTRELYEYHPDTAKQLLQEAGYPNGFKTQVIASSPRIDQIDLAAIVKAYWAAIGVDLEIVVKEASVFSAVAAAKTYQWGIITNMGSVRPFTLSYWRMGAVNNYSMINDSYLNGKIAEIDAAYFNEPLRRQLMKDIAPYILDQAWVLPLPEPYVYTFWQPWVKGYHGEFSVGRLNYYGFSRYIGLDLGQKAAMGY